MLPIHSISLHRDEPTTKIVQFGKGSIYNNLYQGSSRAVIHVFPLLNAVELLQKVTFCSGCRKAFPEFIFPDEPLVTVTTVYHKPERGLPKTKDVWTKQQY